MINGQTLSNNPAEEIFIPIQTEINLNETIKVVETPAENVIVESVARQIELKPKFARLKKAMRRRSVSIF